MVKFSLSEVLNKAQSAKDKANRALQLARTKEEERRAEAMKRRATAEVDKAKKISGEISRLEAERRRTKDEVLLKRQRREIDDLRSEASYRGRIITGVKSNIDKNIDDTLTRWGLPARKAAAEPEKKAKPRKRAKPKPKKRVQKRRVQPKRKPAKKRIQKRRAQPKKKSPQRRR